MGKLTHTHILTVYELKFQNFLRWCSCILSHAITFPSIVSYLHHGNCWVNLRRQWNVNLILISVHTRKVKKILTNTFKKFSKWIIRYYMYINYINSILTILEQVLPPLTIWTLNRLANSTLNFCTYFHYDIWSHS